MRENWFSGFPTRSDTKRFVKKLESSNFGYKKKRHCTIRVEKTKALISFAVTAKLICAFVFAQQKIRFSRDAAHIVKRGFATVYLFFLFLIQNIDCGYLLEPPR